MIVWLDAYTDLFRMDSDNPLPQLELPYMCPCQGHGRHHTWNVFQAPFPLSA